MEVQLQADLDENGRLTIGGVWGLATGGSVQEISFGLETPGNPNPLAIALVAPDPDAIAAELAGRMAQEAASAAQIAAGFNQTADDAARQAVYHRLIVEQAEIEQTINQCFARVIAIRQMFSTLRGVE